MILIISPAKQVAQSAPLLQKAVGEPVRVAASARAAIDPLRDAEFSAVVVDETVFVQNPTASDLLWKHLGPAVPVVMNLAVASVDRVAREVRAALARRDRERSLAARDAVLRLRSELNSALTGILLSSETALALPAVPEPVASKLQSVYSLAMQMKQCLEPAGNGRGTRGA